MCPDLRCSAESLASTYIHGSISHATVCLRPAAGAGYRSTAFHLASSSPSSVMPTMPVGWCATGRLQGPTGSGAGSKVVCDQIAVLHSPIYLLESKNRVQTYQKGRGGTYPYSDPCRACMVLDICVPARSSKCYARSESVTPARQAHHSPTSDDTHREPASAGARRRKLLSNESTPVVRGRYV